MLCIIITLSLLSVLCDGLEPETGPPSHIAVSTQSYRRGDVPLSYKVTSYHDYATKRTENRTPIYAVNNHIPQYTPLKPIYNDQINQPPHQSAFKEQLKLSLFNQYLVKQNTAAEKSNKNLEPRLVVKHGPFQNEKYQSFVSGHNVAVAPRFRHKAPVLTDLYENYKKPVQAQKILIPKYAIQKQKQKQPLLVQAQVIKTEPESTHLQSAGFPVIPGIFPTNTYEVPHEHKEVLFPQPPKPRAPRLHLNIARVYGTAHLSHQAPEPAVNKENPPSHTQAIIVAEPDETIQQKTLLSDFLNRLGIST